MQSIPQRSAFAIASDALDGDHVAPALLLADGSLREHRASQSAQRRILHDISTFIHSPSVVSEIERESTLLPPSKRRPLSTIDSLSRKRPRTDNHDDDDDDYNDNDDDDDDGNGEYTSDNDGDGDANNTSTSLSNQERMELERLRRVQARHEGEMLDLREELAELQCSNSQLLNDKASLNASVSLLRAAAARRDRQIEVRVRRVMMEMPMVV
jgi:hypothetical protein